ncbi:MAG: hypothetical protein JWM53_2950 [bacterium]|nr:hypothetical protein [bacterium]
MSFTWPEFTNEPLDGSRTWSAKFDSYDQRNEDCYYVVTLFDGERATGSFMAQVGTEFAGDDWTRPEVLQQLRARLASVAATGQTNTNYRGPVMRM